MRARADHCEAGRPPWTFIGPGGRLFFVARKYSTRNMTAQSAPNPHEMTAYQCQAELSADGDLARLRALVAARRVILAAAALGVTGTIEGHMQQGVIRSWRFPHVVNVSAPTPQKPAGQWSPAMETK